MFKHNDTWTARDKEPQQETVFEKDFASELKSRGEPFSWITLSWIDHGRTDKSRGQTFSAIFEVGWLKICREGERRRRVEDRGSTTGNASLDRSNT